MRFARTLQELKKMENNDKDENECIYQQLEKIRDFNLDIGKTVAKILNMCTNSI